MCFRYKKKLLTTLLISAFLLLITGCAYKQPKSFTAVTSELKPPNDTFFSYAKVDVGTQLPKSGFYPLASPMESLAARILLMQKAKKSIDLQYYQIGFDEVGYSIFINALEAADRGVKVRFIIDDIGLKGKDKELAMLNAHENVEIRIFNPTYFRNTMKFAEMAFRSDTVGRRMHIKSFGVDSSAVVLGGRNLENAYFGVDRNHIFLDNDILGIGPIAAHLTEEFNLYWNSANVYPLEMLYKGTQEDLAQLRKEADEFKTSLKDDPYIKAAKNTPFYKAFKAKKLDLIFANAKLHYDGVAKVSTDASDVSTHLMEQLKPYILSTKKSLRIINPYFVPNAQLMAFFKKLREENIEIHILTNSLPSADAPFVYAFYKQYQKPLLEMGVHLHEVKSAGFKESAYSHKFKEMTDQYFSVWLHAKTMMIDDETLIVGSMNLDPRSNYLNAEIVTVIKNKELSTVIKEQLFDVAFSKTNSFELALENKPPYKDDLTDRWINDEKEIVWISEEEGKIIKYYNDAGASFSSRLKANLLYYFPIGDTI